jgi:hypothetical protein
MQWLAMVCCYLLVMLLFPSLLVRSEALLINGLHLTGQANLFWLLHLFVFALFV